LGAATPPARVVDEFDWRLTERELSTGYVLSNRYVIQKKLGSGGMGIVYLALDKSLDINVAIKVLNPLLARDERAVRDLKQEARIAMSLGHWNIMKMYNFEDHPDVKFLIMEYIDGPTLDATLIESPERKLPVETVVAYTKQLCEGLQYAHDQKVWHRDIKPANVMVNRAGVVKITDFGIARVAKDSTTRVTGRETSGTLVYMAPEQIRGKSVDWRIDIYSLGATMYELLAGHPPFYTGNISYQILNEPPDPIEGVSEQINEIVLKALAKEKEQRWSTAWELRQALDGRIELAVDRKKREAEEKRKQAEVRRLEDERRREQQRVMEEQKRLAEERARAERLHEQERADEEHQREEKRRAAARLTEELRQVAAIKREAETRSAGEAKRLEQQRWAEEQRREEERRAAARAAEEQKQKERETAQKRLEDEKQKRQRGQPSPKRRRGLWLLSGGLLVLGVVLAIWSNYQETQRRAAARVAEEQRHADEAKRERERISNDIQEKVRQIQAETPMTEKTRKANEDAMKQWDRLLQDLPTPSFTPKPMAFTGASSAIDNVAFSPDGRRVLAGGDIWDVVNGQKIRELASNIDCAVFSPDGRRILSGDIRGQVQLWDVAGGRELRKFPGHNDAVHCVAISPDGRRGLTGGGTGNRNRDYIVRLWDLETGREMHRLAGHADVVWYVAFLADGRRAVSYGDTSIRLWDLDTGRLIRSIKGFTGWKWRVAVSPDGRRALSGGHDTTVRLWDLANGRELHRMKGHKAWVYEVAISPDGRRGLSGGEDKTVRLWDLESGRALAQFEYDGAVRCLAFSPDGRLALAGGSNTVRLWVLP
jgi:hypothetical protein